MRVCNSKKDNEYCVVLRCPEYYVRYEACDAFDGDWRPECFNAGQHSHTAPVLQITLLGYDVVWG